MFLFLASCSAWHLLRTLFLMPRTHIPYPLPPDYDYGYGGAGSALLGLWGEGRLGPALWAAGAVPRAGPAAPGGRRVTQALPQAAVPGAFPLLPDLQGQAAPGRGRTRGDAPGTPRPSRCRGWGLYLGEGPKEVGVAPAGRCHVNEGVWPVRAWPRVCKLRGVVCCWVGVAVTMQMKA